MLKDNDKYLFVFCYCVYFYKEKKVDRIEYQFFFCFIKFLKVIEFKSFLYGKLRKSSEYVKFIKFELVILRNVYVN